MAFRSRQICEFIGVNEASVTRIIRDGKLKAVKDLKTRQWDVDKCDLAFFIVNNKKYYRNFKNYQPSPQLRDSYYILKEEVDKLTQL